MIFRRTARLSPETLELLVGAFRSGLNVDQALNLVAAQVQPRPNSAWPWMPTEAKIGFLFSDPKMDLVRAALKLALHTGSRPGPLIETAVRLLRERIAFEDRVRALTSHGRATAWVVGLAPFAMGAVLLVLAPEMTAPLVQTASGRMILASGLFLIVGGLLIVHKMSRIEP